MEDSRNRKISERDVEVVARPFDALAWLLLVLVIVFVGTNLTRMPLGRGLNGLDFLLMAALPIGAYRAGKEWFCGPIFLVYGAVGIFLFLPGYFSDEDLKNKVAKEGGVISHFVGWCVGVSIIVAACWWAGCIAHTFKKQQAELEHNE